MGRGCVSTEEGRLFGQRHRKKILKKNTRIGMCADREDYISYWYLYFGVTVELVSAGRTLTGYMKNSLVFLPLSSPSLNPRSHCLPPPHPAANLPLAGVTSDVGEDHTTPKTSLPLPYFQAIPSLPTSILTARLISVTLLC